MGSVNVYIHFVWSIKKGAPELTPNIRLKIFDHIKENAVLKNIKVDCVSGWEDHVHCLVKMGLELSISKVLQAIKGESAFWINKHTHLFPSHFAWSDEFYAGSVNPRDLNKVRQYILNQETHHAKTAFADELKELLRNDEVTQLK